MGWRTRGVLSAGEEPVAFGHLVAVFTVCAEHPSHADNAAKCEAYNGRVGFPVCGLGVPATSRRPDVLRVSAQCLASGQHSMAPSDIVRDLSSAAHCGCGCAGLRVVAGVGVGMRSLSHA